MSKRIDSIWKQNFVKAEKVKEVIAERLERSGVCNTCNKGAFTLAIEDHQLLRLCKNCKELYNPDTNTIIRKGVWDDEKENDHDVYGG